MTGHNPTDRSKLGTKRHILTDKDGIPLSVIITSANTHDITVVIDTVDSIVIKRPSSTTTTTTNRNKKQNLCLDKAYHSKEVSRTRNCQKGIHTTYTTQKRGKETHQETSSKKMGG